MTPYHMIFYFLCGLFFVISLIGAFLEDFSNWRGKRRNKKHHRLQRRDPQWFTMEE